VITFITSWSLFGAHRLFIYELPLLGFNFARLRMASVLPVPIIAGIAATAISLVITIKMLTGR
jgi:hypothetical protein